MSISGLGRRLPRRIARILAVARIETLHITRDRTSISLVVGVPLIQILLFGYAINLDPKAVPLAIAEEHGDAGDRLHRAIAETHHFAIVADQLRPGAAERMVAEGKASVGIELPALDYFAADAVSEAPRIVVDASDPAAVRPALAGLQASYWKDVGRDSSFPLPVMEVRWLYNPDGRTAWTIVPGLVGVITMISMLMLGALTLVRERERGSWEALLATPVDAIDALIGKLSPYVVIGTIQAALVLAIARVLFELPVTGNLLALFVAVPLYAAAHLALGFAFSALAESQLQALQGAVFFYLPSMLLSGFMFPFQGMPQWARAIGEALPLTHMVRATRGVLLRGEDAAGVAAEMAPVAMFAAIAAGVALVAYRRRID
jgi:ABC-2 type transport system permease protein